MRKTKYFYIGELRKARKLQAFLTEKGFICNIFSDYIKTGLCLEPEEVFFVKYDKSAQPYVDAWEFFMDVKYI